MARMVVGVLLAAALAGAAAPPAPAAEVRHSGRVVAVADDGSALVLEEIVTWNGPGTGVVRRSIRLTPRTSVRVVERSGVAGVATTTPTGRDTTSIEAAGLLPGDYVTVTTDDDHRDVAVALQVVRSDGW
jgi:hypothetical protein